MSLLLVERADRIHTVLSTQAYTTFLLARALVVSVAFGRRVEHVTRGHNDRTLPWLLHRVYASLTAGVFAAFLRARAVFVLALAAVGRVGHATSCPWAGGTQASFLGRGRDGQQCNQEAEQRQTGHGGGSRNSESRAGAIPPHQPCRKWAVPPHHLCQKWAFPSDVKRGCWWRFGRHPGRLSRLISAGDAQ